MFTQRLISLNNKFLAKSMDYITELGVLNKVSDCEVTNYSYMRNVQVLYLQHKVMTHSKVN